MYTSVWAKYLPIIRIVLKRSLTAEQVLPLNIPDFERAGLKRKSGYKFNIGLKNGKSRNVIIDSPLASCLVNLMMEDRALRDLISSNEFNISLSPKFELTITHIPQVPEEAPEDLEVASA